MDKGNGTFTIVQNLEGAFLESQIGTKTAKEREMEERKNANRRRQVRLQRINLAFSVRIF